MRKSDVFDYSPSLAQQKPKLIAIYLTKNGFIDLTFPTALQLTIH